MKPRRVLADTGPLVAILSPSDQYHEACTEAAKRLEAPLLTSWPVITEAAYLLRKRAAAVERLLELIAEGAITILDLDRAALGEIHRILKRYRSLSPQLADATLVYLAEREGIDTIFTLDRRDFSIYRTSRGKAFRLEP